MFKAKNRETHEIVALKRVRLDDDDEVGLGHGRGSKAYLVLCVTTTPLHVVGCAKFSPTGDLSTQRTEAQKHCQVRSVGEDRTSSLDWAGIGMLETN